MSNHINTRAWDILTPDERTALNLQYLHDKSTWEAGDVMNKAHYKYLEIKYRAEHFLRIFTTHFEIYDELIPSNINMGKHVRLYLNLVISKRLIPREAFIVVFKELGVNKKSVERDLTTWILNNQKSDLLTTENTIGIIKEFDRANNYRILTKEVQEPSFYKRRDKNVHKKRIKLITKLSPLAIDILKRSFSAKNKTGFYTGVVNNGEITIFNVRKQYVSRIGEFGLYVWEDYNLVNTYVNLIYTYLGNTTKNCKAGLNFWPKYRELIPKASNYLEVQKLTPNRKLLEVAAKNLEIM